MLNRPRLKDRFQGKNNVSSMWRICTDYLMNEDLCYWQEEEAMTGAKRLWREEMQSTDHRTPLFTTFVTVEIKLLKRILVDCQFGDLWCACFSTCTETHFLPLMTQQALRRCYNGAVTVQTFYPIIPPLFTNSTLPDILPASTLQSFICPSRIVSPRLADLLAHFQLNLRHAVWKFRLALRLFVSALIHFSH